MLQKILTQQKKMTIDKWYKQAIKNYSPVGYQAFIRTDEPFSNPVACNIFQTVEALYNYIIDDELEEKNISPRLNETIKLMVLQSVQPSEAVKFIYQFKEIVQLSFIKEIEEFNLFSDLISLYNKIDAISMLAFDLYMMAQKKLSDVKSKQLKDNTFRLLQKANLINDECDSFVMPNCS